MTTRRRRARTCRLPWRPISSRSPPRSRGRCGKYYEERRESLGTQAGLNTLLTNSWFAERRTDSLLAVLYRASELESVSGLRVLDVGCGFGSLAAVLAARGAEVKAVDVKAERFEVGEAVAR